MSETEHALQVRSGAPDIDGPMDALARIRRFNPSFTLAFLKNSPDAVSVLSSDGAIEYINTNGLALLGFERCDEIVGLPWDSLWPVETRALVLDAIHRVSHGDRTRYTSALGYLNAPDVCCDITLSPLTSPDGRVDAVLAIVRKRH